MRVYLHLSGVGQDRSTPFGDGFTPLNFGNSSQAAFIRSSESEFVGGVVPHNK